ncbi:MAG: hypothetical protein HC936_02345 [Leptolyngbyaceae cyanobacterium SU_3_3]|nr:hypothetical protein [Leptolyngbyaceae cyanobacterium SU_3_3]
MSGIQTILALPAGATVRGSLVVPSTHVCQLQQTILFANARSFVRPTPSNKAAFRDLLTRLGIPSTQPNLMLVGHTDSPGTQASNTLLSERRTQSVLAVLKSDAARWEVLYTLEGWNTPELTAMVIEVGDAAAGDTPAINLAVTRNRTDPTARQDLFRRYFIRLLNSTPVPPIQPNPPVLLNCGEGQLLRGRRASPSRDPSQPPIEGDFEPNRRVEFFFFDNASPTLTCAEYPKWTIACSLVPPPAPVITVTIAPIDIIRVGTNADIQVTVNPSPLPFGTSITLTLSTTSGTGNAQFTATSTATTTITTSGIVTIRGSAPSGTIDNIRHNGNSHWHYRSSGAGRLHCNGNRGSFLEV